MYYIDLRCFFSSPCRLDSLSIITWRCVRNQAASNQTLILNLPFSFSRLYRNLPSNSILWWPWIVGTLRGYWARQYRGHQPLLSFVCPIPHPKDGSSGKGERSRIGSRPAYEAYAYLAVPKSSWHLDRESHIIYTTRSRNSWLYSTLRLPRHVHRYLCIVIGMYPTYLCF